MRSIELLIVLAVTAFNLAVMPWRTWLDQLVSDSQLLAGFLKERYLGGRMTAETVGELRTVVSLDALNGERELFHAVLKEDSGRIRAVFLKSLQIAETGVFVDECVLIELLPLSFSHMADSRHILDVDLHALAGIKHLFVGLGNILGIGELHSHLIGTSEHAIQAGDGAGILPLAKLDPEDDKTRIRIPSTHVSNQCQLCLRVLIRMAVGTMRMVI